MEFISIKKAKYKKIVKPSSLGSALCPHTIKGIKKLKSVFLF